VGWVGVVCVCVRVCVCVCGGGGGGGGAKRKFRARAKEEEQGAKTHRHFAWANAALPCVCKGWECTWQRSNAARLMPLVLLPSPLKQTLPRLTSVPRLEMAARSTSPPTNA
jgi:predicted alternative tryptophan synthase beta-subunit